MLPALAVLVGALSLVPACTRRPPVLELSSAPGAPSLVGVAAATGPAIAVEGEEGVNLTFAPIDGGALIVASADFSRAAFALAEGGGARHLPELGQGPRLRGALERVRGTWPGTIWLQTLEVEQDVRPEDPPWTSWLYRYDAGAWRQTGDTKSGEIYWATWLPSPGCLVGIRDHSRRAADCPSRPILIRGIPGTAGQWAIRLGATSPTGDAFLFEESCDAEHGYRVRIVRADDPPTIDDFALPLPVEALSSGGLLTWDAQSLQVHTSVDAYLRGELSWTPPGSGRAQSVGVFLHFDGRAWSPVTLPRPVPRPAFAVAPDGSLIIAVDEEGGRSGDFSVWRRAPQGAWKREITYGAPPGEGRWHPFQIWARFPDDLWIASTHTDASRGRSRDRILRTKPVDRVWRPTRAMLEEPKGTSGHDRP